MLQERPRRAIELILLTLLLHCLEIGALLSATAILEELLRAMHRVLVKMYGGSRVLWEVLGHYGSLSHTNSSDVVPWRLSGIKYKLTRVSNWLLHIVVHLFPACCQGTRFLLSVAVEVRGRLQLAQFTIRWGSLQSLLAEQETLLPILLVFLDSVKPVSERAETVRREPCLLAVVRRMWMQWRRWQRDLTRFLLL